VRFLKETKLDEIEIKCEIEGPPYQTFSLLERPQMPRLGIVLSIRSQDNVAREIHSPMSCTLVYSDIGDYIGVSGRLLANASQVIGEARGFSTQLIQTKIPVSGAPAKFFFFADISPTMIDQIDSMLLAHQDQPLHLGIMAIADLVDGPGSPSQKSRRMQLTITDIEIPRQTWFQWTQAWGKYLRFLTLRGNLTKQFDQLKEKWNVKDDLDLIGILLERCEDLASPKIEQELAWTKPPKREIRSLIEQMLGRAKETVRVMSPYFDGSMVDPLARLAAKGLSVSLITRPKEAQTQKAHSQALEVAVKEGIKVKFDKMIHARLLVVDEFETLVSSADLTADSLDSNRELAARTTNINAVRKSTEFFDEIWKSLP
jgi:hypothetical protein